MARKTIYMDVAATTPVYSEVVREMENVYLEEYGNPSSLHGVGEKAFDLMTEARKELAREIGAKSWEIVFTSGGTESNNLALLGVARTNEKGKRKKVLISSIEHPSVLEVGEVLKKDGWDVQEIKVGSDGRLDFEDFEKKIDDNTLLVSVMHVNNEIGVIQDLEKTGGICKSKDVLFHCDGVQSFGKLEIDVKKMGIDLFSASGHKIGGPKGVGFLYIREGIKVEPLNFGGGQERGFRGGTENVPGIVGFGKALEMSKKVDRKEIGKLRDNLIEGLERLGGKINGSRKDRIYNNVNVSFRGLEGESLVLSLSKRGVMASTGSACSSKKKAESKTLRALGLKKREIDGSVRFSLGPEISVKDVDFVVKETSKILDELRV